MRFLFFLTFFLFFHITFSQVNKREGNIKSDSITFYRPTYKDYKYSTESTDKQIFDTANTAKNYFKNTNYTNKNQFGGILLSNIGQPFNSLIYNESSSKILLLPLGKSFSHYDETDVKYYDVKTPTTEFIYHNGMKEGHALSTLFTHNFHSRFNYALQYRGLRSMGKYLNSLSEANNFIFTTNYQTKNGRYKLWAHYSNENIDNQENAGIKNTTDFESGETRFKNRLRLVTNLESAKSLYDYRRYYITQQFGLIKKQTKDSVDYFPISLRNKFSYETIEYIYKETPSDTLYANYHNKTFLYSSLQSQNRESHKRHKTFRNTTTVQFQWNDNIWIDAGMKYENLRYFAPEALQIDGVLFPEGLEDNRIGTIISTKIKWSEWIKLNTDAEFMSGNLLKSTYFINANLQTNAFEKLPIEAELRFASDIPSLNYLFNQSFYKEFNYYNVDFSNLKTYKIGGKVSYTPYKTSISASATSIQNYTYIDADFSPRQISDNISILQIEAENTLNYNKFYWYNKVLYQQSSSHQNELPLPQIIWQSALYYQNNLFNKAANVQAGISGYYFSSFNSKEYFPLLNEFKQNTNSEQKIGNFPILNIFLNVKVKTMRMYIEAQHFNSSFTGYNYYAAPNIPYPDFRLNLGLIWYIFT